MSNVLLEAAATGRPVITSDIYGCREAVDEGITGLLCIVKDADSLYAQMKKMALLSRSEREQMGLAARKKMEHQFDKKVVVKNTIDALMH
jgi:galacturonosyltransferase